MMDISPGRLADNAVYYLYLADPGRHIKSGDGDPGSLLGAHKISTVPAPPQRPQHLLAFQSHAVQ